MRGLWFWACNVTDYDWYGLGSLDLACALGVSDLCLQQSQPSVVVTDLCDLLQHTVHPAETNIHTNITPLKL